MSALEYWSDGLMKDTQTITPLRQYSITQLPNRRWRAIQYRSKLVQMSWSLPIFRVAGIQLRIHITFLLLIAWLAFGYYAQGGSAVAASRVIFVLLLFLCVVLHEFGHAFAAKAFGINTPDITLLPIGGVARLERMPEEPVQELIIAVAGPLVNVVIALGLFVAGGFQALLNPSNIEGGGLVAQLLTINIMLVLFNLLPAFPMDGGRVLRALLATRLSYARATQVAANVGQGFAFVFGFIGLLWNPFLLFIALFVYIGASQEAALAQMKDVSRRFPVSSAMVREFRTLLADDSLQEAVDALLATSQHDFPVVDDAGNVAGLLTRQDLIGALRKNDPSLRVGDVMRRDIPTVTTGTRFEDAFRIMQECNCPAVPVLDRMKRLVGLLTPENVTELMMVQSAMPQRRVL
jgi:Zn-dependent protease/CBS domain-containing protein